MLRSIKLANFLHLDITGLQHHACLLAFFYKYWD